MKIMWDEHKRIQNVGKHDPDFGALDIEFFVKAVILNARDGRRKAIGILANNLVTIIFVRLGLQATSFISLCPASRKEWSVCEQYQSKNSNTHGR